MTSVVNVNVGLPRRVSTGRRTVTTAIWKTPVEGRVAVRGVNLEGDGQADRSLHGGPDKAVYAYAGEEIRAWEHELGRDLGAAPFGENLTTAGLAVSEAVVGERWRIGTTLLEVAQPRTPCFKLGLRMGDATFLRRFAQAERPGAYLRIVEEGVLGAGDAIDVVHVPDHEVTVRLVFQALLGGHHLFERVLRAPQLPTGLRAWMSQGLAD